MKELNNKNQGDKVPTGLSKQLEVSSRHDDITTSLNFDQLIQGISPTLKQCIHLMDTYEERKIATYAVITLAGSLMANVAVNYDGSVNHPQLMLLI